MTAVVCVPVIMGVGLAVDASNITRTQTALQQAIDSAALAVASEGKDIPDSRANQVAEQFLASNFDLPISDVDVIRVGTKVTVDARARASLAFGGLLGYQDWQVRASASADIAYAAYEIGLVLDTTGSMAGGKLASMKGAVGGLIDSMSAQVTNKEKLKFALVPFSSFVNVGPDYGPKFDKKGKQIAGTGAAWLDLGGDSDIAQKELEKGLSRFQLYRHLNKSWPGCVETRGKSGTVDLGVTDTLPAKADASTLFVPAFAIDEEDTGYANSYLPGNVATLNQSNGAQRKKMKKYGVPKDKDNKIVDFGTTVLDPLLGPLAWTPVSVDSSAANGMPKGPGYNCVTKPIAPLSNDYSGLKTAVDALVAAGNTNIMEGVAWGMRVLSPGEPFTQGKDAKKTGVNKMMIVLTDGSNTLGTNGTALGSTYSSFGYLVDGRLGISSGGAPAAATAMNARTLAACDAAKAEGIEVYTIRLEEPNVATGSMLKDCASSPAHYFDVPSRTQLDEVFSTIGDRIVQIRMSS